MFRTDTTGFTLICLLMLLLGSCKTEIDTDKHMAVAKEILTVHEAFNQSYKTIAQQVNLEDELFDGYTNQYNSFGCVTTVLTPDSSQFFPALLDIDFGKDCSLDGDVFNGAVSLIVDGFMNKSESSAALSFHNYSINESKLAADYTIRNKGKNEQDYTLVEHQIFNGAFKNNAFGQSNYSVSIFSTQVIGLQSSFETNGSTALADDVWEHNFSGTFVSATGEIYNFQSETNIVDHWSCNFPSAGRMIINGEDLETDIILDFGNGTCDRNFTIDLKGEISTLSLE